VTAPAPVAISWPSDPVLKFDLCERRDGRFFRPDLAPGAARYVFGHDGKPIALNFVCPCGCALVSTISFCGQHPRWHFDGNEERPTLTPSVQITHGCRWHGHLVAGVWQTMPNWVKGQ
jgi:hypothetical protein